MKQNYQLFKDTCCLVLLSSLFFSVNAIPFDNFLKGIWARIRPISKNDLNLHKEKTQNDISTAFNNQKVLAEEQCKERSTILEQIHEKILNENRASQEREKVIDARFVSIGKKQENISSELTINGQKIARLQESAQKFESESKSQTTKIAGILALAQSFLQKITDKFGEITNQMDQRQKEQEERLKRYNEERNCKLSTIEQQFAAALQQAQETKRQTEALGEKFTAIEQQSEKQSKLTTELEEQLRKIRLTKKHTELLRKQRKQISQQRQTIPQQ